MSQGVPYPQAGVSGGPSPGGTVWGATSLRKALEGFRTLIALAVSVSVLVLVREILLKTGVLPGTLPAATAPWSEWQSQALRVGADVAIGLAIAVLVIIGIVVAVRGLIAWRRGVLAMAQGSSEYGPSQVDAALLARADHSRTLWLFLGYVLVAIGVAISFAIVNASLGAVHSPLVPDTLTSIVSGLATGSVLVLIYFFGGRHLDLLLHGLASPGEQALLVRGRHLLLAGALVGLGAAFAPLLWELEAAGLVSLVLVLFGAHDLLRAYVRWLAGERSASLPGITAPPLGHA